MTVTSEFYCVLQLNSAALITVSDRVASPDMICDLDIVLNKPALMGFPLKHNSIILNSVKHIHLTYLE